MAKQKSSKSSNGANLGFEAELWQTADALRSNMDAAEYKHVVLGLIFLKYISDAFEEQHAELEAEKAQGADPEDPDEYRALTTSSGCRRRRAGRTSRRKRTAADDRHSSSTTRWPAIERDNPSLKGVLPKDYARPALDKQRLGELIDLISNIALGDAGEPRQGHARPRLRVLPRAVRQRRGQERRRVLHAALRRPLLVEMLAPYKGRVYDPCCGSGGMFVQSRSSSRHARRQRRRATSRIYGQESNHTTWRLAKMNLAIRGIDGQIAHGDTFHNDLHPDLKADFVLANPPFNDQRLGRRPAARRQALEVRHAAGRQRQLRLGPALHPPPRAHRASPASCSPTARCRRTSRARARSARASSRPTSSTAWSRCRASSSTRRRSRSASGSSRATRRTASFRDRRGETLFIDARKLGTLVDRTHRELTDDDIAQIAGTYHAWRGDKDAGEYADVPGFCKSRHARRDPQARPRAHARPLRRRRGAGGRRRAVRGEDEAARRDAARAAGRSREAGRRIAANLKELGYGG